MNTNPQIEEVIQVLKQHTRSNAETAAIVGRLIEAMGEQHADMQEQHRDLQEQHADNQSINRMMMWATVAMTIATVVMAWDAVSG